MRGRVIFMIPPVDVVILASPVGVDHSSGSGPNSWCGESDPTSWCGGLAPPIAVVNQSWCDGLAPPVSVVNQSWCGGSVRTSCLNGDRHNRILTLHRSTGKRFPPHGWVTVENEPT